MVTSCGIVSYIICMFYFLCEITIIMKSNKFIYFSYIDITISVYGIMFINNNNINKKYNTTFLDLKPCWFL